MTNGTFEIEQTYPASADKVWIAITDKDEMKLWYFDLPEFKPEVGVEFRFMGGPSEDRKYLHICKIAEVIRNRKIAYSWCYDGYAGNTLVSFELFEEGAKTRLKLTHEGLDTFPAENPDLAKENFAEGWTEIIGTSLKNYIENKYNH